MAIKESNITLHTTFSRTDNELLKLIAKNKNTSVSKLCKEYILRCMKKDLKEVKKNGNE